MIRDSPVHLQSNFIQIAGVRFDIAELVAFVDGKDPISSSRIETG